MQTAAIEKTTSTIRRHMSTSDRVELNDFVVALKAQIGFGGFMTLGARNFSYRFDSASKNDEFGYSFFDPTMSFDANILSMEKDGTRSNQVRKMRVDITLNAIDYYDVLVSYQNRGETVAHYEGSDIDAASISRRMVALDFDGNEVLNPRYI